MQNNIWSILGIEPTKDTKIIKKAYSKLLKQIDANNVAEFQELKDAFDSARKFAKADREVVYHYEDIFEIEDTYTEFDRDNSFKFNDMVDKENDSNTEIKLSTNTNEYIESIKFYCSKEVIIQFERDIAELDLDNYARVIQQLYRTMDGNLLYFDLKILEIVYNQLNVIDNTKAYYFEKRIENMPKFIFYDDSYFNDYHILRCEVLKKLKDYQFAESKIIIERMMQDYPKYNNEIKTFQLMHEIIMQRKLRTARNELINLVKECQSILIENPDNYTAINCLLCLEFRVLSESSRLLSNNNLCITDGLNKLSISLNVNQLKDNYLLPESEIYRNAIKYLLHNKNKLNDENKELINEEIKLFQLEERELESAKPKKRFSLSTIFYIIFFIIGIGGALIETITKEDTNVNTVTSINEKQKAVNILDNYVNVTISEEEKTEIKGILETMVKSYVSEDPLLYETFLFSNPNVKVEANLTELKELGITSDMTVKVEIIDTKTDLYLVSVLFVEAGELKFYNIKLNVSDKVKYTITD